MEELKISCETLYNPFIKTTQKCSPFTQVPMKCISKSVGDFGNKHRVILNNSKADFCHMFG